MRTLYLGSGPFGGPALETLAASEPDLVVGTVPDAPRGRRGKPVPTVIKTRALELGLPVHEVDSLKGAKGPTILVETGAELVITCDFRLILGRKFLAGPRRGCWNLHGSLLPRHRGAAPVARGILAGDTEFGVTLYRMVYALDAGPMLDAVRFRPDRPLDAEQIEAELSRLAAELLERSLPALRAGEVELEEQDERLATLAPKLEKHEGWVDWSRPAAEIERRIRALRPWPRAFTEFGEPAAREGAVRIFLDRAIVDDAIDEAVSPLEPGRVRRADAAGIRVACGDGTETLCILELQRAGKRTLAAEEFLRGTSLEGGRFLDPPDGGGR